VIGEGEYFTRWPLVKGGPPVSSRCRKCAPFDLRMAEKEREPALIDALLRPGPGDSSAKGWPASARQDVQERERLRQAARDRLAPALAYIRRRRTTGDR
jgi:hypothetical protein